MTRSDKDTIHKRTENRRLLQRMKTGLEVVTHTPYKGVLLGAYLVNNDKQLSLADFLDKQVFAGDAGVEIAPVAEDVAGFNAYIEHYKACLPVEEAAVSCKK